MSPLNYRPTKMLVNLDAIRSTIRKLTEYLPEKTMTIAVVKANGYGHGDVEVALAAFEAGAGMVSVATPDEALRLRERGIKGDILVMGPSPVSFALIAAELGISVTVPDENWLLAVNARNWEVGMVLKVHVKIDSGMGRIGLRDKQSLELVVDTINNSEHFLFEGIFTHFASADEEDATGTRNQFEKFMELVGTLHEKPRLVHASNSAATLLYPEYALDAVRFGISMYGIAPSTYVEGKIPFHLERALTLETELAHVKKVPAGSFISYGATYETTEDEWIGTLPIGYADGLRRGLRGQEVLIDGKRMPLVGTICMDQCMVKLPNEYPVGQKVVLLGVQGDEEIKMEEWADRLDTIPYEIAVTLMKRIPRIFTGENGQHN